MLVAYEGHDEGDETAQERRAEAGQMLQVVQEQADAEREKA